MRKYLFLIGCSCACAQPALADDKAAGGADIIVTATGLPQSIDRTGQAVTVIGREEIEQVQGADITRVLRRLPGTTFTRTGPLGSLTLLGVRGAPAGQTLVLIDGVRANDPASANAEFDLSQLAAGTIESIELLRGPNSVVWGSQAMGGVMNITTRIENGYSASLEYGGARRVTATGAAGYADERLEAGLSGSFVDGQGHSAAASGTEDDGFRQYNIGGRARYRLSDALSLVADARYARGKVELDGFPPPAFTFADADVSEKLTAWSGRIGAMYESDALTLNAGYALADTERVGDDPYFPYALDGRSERAELFGRVSLPAGFALDFGADHEWSRFANAPDAGKANTTSGHALLGYYGDRLQLAAGLRYDDHSRFGGEWTFGANGAFEFAPGWRLRAAYGEGFKAPTLYQLLSQYGNPALAPERSKGYEAGIAHGRRGEPVFLALTAYRRDSRNLVDFFSCWGGSDPLCATRPFGFYYNVGKGRAQGAELEAGLELQPGLTTSFAYSYTDTENRTPGDPDRGNRFARRPEHLVTASLDWDVNDRLALGLDIRWNGAAWDDRGNHSRLESYVLGDVRASWRVHDRVELFGRVENLWNERYVIAAGYGTEGRAAYVGVRLRK
ncbi:MAG: TonB-dependent receptor [Novosphingobium sp.]|nr:TonB-dependent receptor [Novosphingobium sp.]MCP5379483.1 TonB-dependent receptor [Novosphingobium sp.]MCP5388570.1 TonB-dependent receptor [Novosphingobium sp.]